MSLHHSDHDGVVRIFVGHSEIFILVVTDLKKVLYDDAVNQAASHSQVAISTSGNNRPFCFSGVHDSWETSRNTYGHYLLSPIELWPFAVVSHIATIHVHAKNSNGTTLGKFSNFILLRGRFTPFLLFSTSLCLLPLHSVVNELYIHLKYASYTVSYHACKGRLQGLCWVLWYQQLIFSFIYVTSTDVEADRAQPGRAASHGRKPRPASILGGALSVILPTP